jgi:hypothetical protein
LLSLANNNLSQWLASSYSQESRAKPRAITISEPCTSWNGL